jgi:hypothetical protein
VCRVGVEEVSDFAVFWSLDFRVLDQGSSTRTLFAL